MERVEAIRLWWEATGRENPKPNKEIAAEIVDSSDRRVGKNTQSWWWYAISKNRWAVGIGRLFRLLLEKSRLAEPKRARRLRWIPGSMSSPALTGATCIAAIFALARTTYRWLDQWVKAKLNCLNSTGRSTAADDCQQETTDAGGHAVIRCRWCWRAYCEDCLDWEENSSVGTIW